MHDDADTRGYSCDVVPTMKVDGVDVLAAFEHQTGDQLPDPHAVYRDVRAETGPVYPGSLLRERLGAPTPERSEPTFTLIGYRAVTSALRDVQHFSSTAYEDTVGRTMGRNLLMMDGPEHAAHRQLLVRAFSRQAMDKWREQFVEPFVAASLDELLPRGRAELMSDFCLGYPVSVIHHILGLTPEELVPLQTYAVGLLLYASEPQVAMTCSQRLGELLADSITERRANPTDDVIGVLCTTPMSDGNKLTDDEIVSFLRLLLPAGGETTMRGLGSLLAHLLADPSTVAAVRDDRSLVPGAIEEALRMESPTQFVFRKCAAPIEIEGVRIPAGALVDVCVGAANRDPEVFDDPDTFRLDRERSVHAAFGGGAHLCLGMHLARMEMSVAIEAILDRLPHLRYDDQAGSPVVRGVTFRSPGTVSVVWNS
jgi:cytochrome P450